VRFASAFLLSAAFAGLAILVAAGAFTGLDQWAIDHVMPGGRFTGGAPTVLDALIPFSSTHWDSVWSIAVNVVTLPASFVVAVVLIAWRSRVLAVAMIVAVAVETLTKDALTRPALDHDGRHVVAFDNSFPSGHTLRIVIVASAFLSPWWTAWAVVSIALLQLAGWHTPSDIAGGLVLGCLALLGARGAARALGARGLPRSRAA
jgi:membrane-associated phospholipid phosphatase